MQLDTKKYKYTQYIGLILLGTFVYSGSAVAEFCQLTQCTITGTSGDDQLVGTSGDDVICGLEGNDVLVGLGGDDHICAGPGNDIVFGGGGSNIVQGDQGDDAIYSTSATDTIFDTQGENYIKPWSDETRVLDNSDRIFSSAVSSDLAGSATNRSPDYDFNIPRFTTENNIVYGPDGSPFDLRGVSIFPWNISNRDLDGINECWGFNAVRLHSWILANKNSKWKDHVVYVDEPLVFEPDQTEFRTYDIAPIIDEYTSRGIVVVVDIHELIGKYFAGSDLFQYLAFIEDLALRYRNNPYVWIDLHNEPGSWEGRLEDYDDWRNQMLLTLDTVRSVAPDMMLLIAGTAWGQDTGPKWGHATVKSSQSALLANADIFRTYDNVIAKFHMYDQWTFGAQRVQNFIDRLYASSEAPVVIGEYGSWNGSSTIKATQYLHDLIKEPGYEHIGRNVWTWAANDLNDLVNIKDGSGYHVDSCDSPTNLTPLGEMVWDDNQSHR